MALISPSPLHGLAAPPLKFDGAVFGHGKQPRACMAFSSRSQHTNSILSPVLAPLAGVVMLGWHRLQVRLIAGSQGRRHHRLQRHATKELIGCGPGRDIRLFLDTADTEEWERLLPLGFFFGVTTNPVLFQRAGVQCSVGSCKELLKIAKQYPGIQEVMFQAWGESARELADVGQQLRNLDPTRVVVKLPLTEAGLGAAALLRQKYKMRSKWGRMKLCMTTCYASQQSLLATGLRAEYIAPYLGRMAENIDVDGEDKAIQDCVDMHKVAGDRTVGATRILVASLRSVHQMMRLAVAGLDTFTFSPKVCDELLSVEATQGAAVEFQQAAQAMYPK
eukprot:TRINITY_DN66992_c0_g1_i1.p1 TRINITY_DN66992_c0_g1~~TRINITY_DN66992_c0_g1_i1.p1  ORF type:complete len:334 (-),score=45.98 TRINITY_DN66992_c0_g1_i1:50-1051(-)